MDSPLLRRPNGRPQACEVGVGPIPCRRRKVACDHTQPTCRRCIKRRQEGECVYIISNDRPQAPSVLRSSSTPLASPRAPDRTPPAQYARSPEPIVEIAAAAQPSVGYLGFTSYSSVFEETENALGVTAATTTSSSASNVGGPSDAPRRPSPSILEACLKILRNVPETSNGIALFREFPTPFDGFPHVVAKRMVRSLYETFGRYLGAQRNPRHMELVARKLCANSSRPFSETEPDAEKWIAQFVGENTRWESLGILFTFWDLYQTAEGVPRYVYHHKSKFTGRVVATRQSLKLCAEVCNELGAANSLLLHVSQKLCVAESTYSGDASFATWRAHADTIALLTFLGVHAEQNPPDYKPTLVSELRRNLFAWIYNLDTVIVSFTGRPPLISGTYSSTPLPLDLDDEELLDEGRLAEAVRGLDENGWRVVPRLTRFTFTRARAMLAMIREEIFRVALGYGHLTALETLLELKERAIRTLAQIPSLLHYSPSDLHDAGVQPPVLYSKLLVQLEHLQNILFIERLSLRHGKMDRADIIAVSFDMVSYTLPFWTNHDRLAPMRDDCEWLVMAHAAPAGGILCLELLKPTLQGAHPTNPEITRSSIIQKLSLLVGFLDWIRPSAPNSELCASCRVVIRHVLDCVLNEGAAGQGVQEPREWELGASMDFNFELLDTFDWLR